MQCLSSDNTDYLIKAITETVNLLCSVRVPSEVVPCLCGATLLSSSRKNGGLRPIAVGEVLRCLTSKYLSRHAHHDAFQYLTPHQVGVGVKVGHESIVHSVSYILEDSNVPAKDKWTLLIDFSNGFNSISRRHMFEEFRSHVPSLSAWIESCYSSQPKLYLGENTILSCTGVQQGDPLGLLGFALTLHPIVIHIKEEVPDLKVNAWYLDDSTLCGSPSDLVRALEIIEETGAQRGLTLNWTKSLLYIPPNAETSETPSLKKFRSVKKVSLSWIALLAPKLLQQYIDKKRPESQEYSI